MIDKRTAHKENPCLYEVNTAAWLSELSRMHGKRFTIGSVPDNEWDGLSELGFDYVWLMGIWKRSKEGIRIFRQTPEWPPFRQYLDTVFPGWNEHDFIGSPYSIASYEPDPLIGTWDDIQKARAALHKRNMGLVLDFVPNHVAPDHPWISEHPDYFFITNRSAREQDPSLYSKIMMGGKIQYIARGRDPNFPPWSDTAQLNYFNPAMREAMVSELSKIAGYSDGLRCDMAMLVLGDIFDRDWRDLAGSTGARGKVSIQKMPGVEFWEQARTAVPGKVLMAEAYWNTESRLLELGFDYVYDKTLYDRLRNSSAHDIKLHLCADAAYQKKLVRFIENHDEPRSLEAFGPNKFRAAATLFSTLPGMKLYHNGQLEGRKIKLPVQLGRGPDEKPDRATRTFYGRLLSIISQDVFHDGQWKLEDAFPFADDSYQNLVAYTWKSANHLKLVAINLGDGLSQGRVLLKDEFDNDADYIFADELNGQNYRRRGSDLINTGLHVILEGYQSQIFEIFKK